MHAIKGPFVRARGLSVTLAIALVAMAAVAPTVGAKASLRAVGDVEVPPEGFALLGSRLLAFRFDGDQYSLHEHDLAEGTDRVLATVPGWETTVQDLVAGDDWAVWADDRSGDLDVYAVQVSTGALRRLSDSTVDDHSPTIQGSHVVWVRQGVLLEARLDGDGEPAIVPTSGAAAEPALAGQALVWVLVPAAAGTNRTLMVSQGGTESVLHRAGGAFPGNPRSDGMAMAWMTPVLRNPAQPGHGILGTVVQLATSPEGPVTNLTERTDPARSLAVGGGRACWLQGPTIRCHSWRDGTETTTQVEADGLAVSSLATVVYRQGGTFGQLLVVAPEDSSVPAAPWPLVVLGLLLGAFAGRRSTRRD